MLPFNIMIHIEGNEENLYVVPAEDNHFQIYDDKTFIGNVWQEDREGAKCWCAEGAMAKAYSDAIGEAISANLP